MVPHLQRWLRRYPPSFRWHLWVPPWSMTSVGNAEANGGTDAWSPESPRRGCFLLFFHVFLSGKSARFFSETMLQKSRRKLWFFHVCWNQNDGWNQPKTSENHAVVYLWPGLELIKIPRDILGIAVIGFKVPAFLDLGSFCCSFHVGRYVLVTASDHSNQVVFGYLDG